MRARHPLSIFLAVSLLCSACYTSFELPSQELYKLNGYREPQTVSLQTADGDTVPFSAKSELAIEAATGEKLNAKYARISVDGNIFKGVIAKSGVPVSIDLGQVMTAEVRNLSMGKTLGLGLGLGLGIPVVIVVVAVAVVLGTASANGFAR